MRYSFIIPVYNRPDEVDELLDSLTRQTFRDFEVVVVEDGSAIPCQDVVGKYTGQLTIHYYNKENSGPGQTRNYGVERANGEYMLSYYEDKFDVYVTLRTEGRVNNRGHFAESGRKLMYGDTIKFSNGFCETSGMVEKIVVID